MACGSPDVVLNATSLDSSSAVRFAMASITSLSIFAHVTRNVAKREDIDAVIRIGAGKWAQWFEHLNVPLEKAVQKLTFETTNFNLVAGTKGLGIAIAAPKNRGRGCRVRSIDNSPRAANATAGILFPGLFRTLGDRT